MKLAAEEEDFARALQLQGELRALESSAGSGESGQEAAGNSAPDEELEKVTPPKPHPSLTPTLTLTLTLSPNPNPNPQPYP